jgi:thiol-disulfide isomerase/thioredoxin
MSIKRPWFADQPSFLLLALAAALAALSGCGSESKPVTAETSKFRPAGESQPAGSEPAPGSPAAVVDPPASGRTAAAAPSATDSNKSPYASSAANSSANTPSPKTSATTTSPKASISTTPGNDLEQLVAHMDQLAQQPPKGSNQQEQLQDFIRTQQQRLATAKKALGLSPDKPTKQRIIQAMYEVYRLQNRLGMPGAKAELAEFAKSLSTDADPEFSRMGRYVLFDTNVSRIAAQPLTDGQEILAEVTTLLDAEKGALNEQTLQLASQAAEVLMQSGLNNDAAGLLDLLAAAAAADPNQKLADQAGKYADRARLVKSDLTTLLTDFLANKEGAESKLLAAVQTILTGSKPSAELFSNLREVAMYVEHAGSVEAAKSCYEMIETAFKDIADPQLAEAVTQTLASAKKRVSLVGQPFDIEGLTLDGKPFDWSAYQGKVVLVDFWATWCQPCLAELPNIRRNFEQFHTLGFDVIGINLNTDLKDVQQFFSVQELPWTTVTTKTVVDNMAGEDWTKLPMAEKCGVDAIPFLVLVGKDGKVDSLHVRGPKLRARLAQLLGEPPTAEVPADPTAPPASGTAKPLPAKKTGGISPRVPPSPVAMQIARSLFAADFQEPPPVAEDPAINPYKAKPGLSPNELVEYIQKMLDKSKTIQTRAGFGEAIVDACDRIMAADPPAKEADLLMAAETKLAVLHRLAASGNEAADKQLAAFVEELKDDQRPRIASEVKFFRLERRVLDAAQAPLEEIPVVLTEVKEYMAKEKPTARHLRLASSTIALVNRLEDGDQREKYFAELGPIFAKSEDKELARYGKKLAKKPAAETLP